MWNIKQCSPALHSGLCTSRRWRPRWACNSPRTGALLRDTRPHSRPLLWTGPWRSWIDTELQTAPPAADNACKKRNKHPKTCSWKAAALHGNQTTNASRWLTLKIFWTIQPWYLFSACSYALMTFTRIKLGLFSSFSPSARLCRRIWMKRRPLQGRGSLKLEPLQPAAPTARGWAQASGLSSPFQPHQGQRGSHLGPLPRVGFSFGDHDVLQRDIP